MHDTQGVALGYEQALGFQPAFAYLSIQLFPLPLFPPSHQMRLGDDVADVVISGEQGRRIVALFPLLDTASWI